MIFMIFKREKFNIQNESVKRVFFKIIRYLSAFTIFSITHVIEGAKLSIKPT